MISNLSFIIILIILIIWDFFWKGYSAWTAAKAGHKWWFVFLLILNTMGILQIYYLFYVAKKTPQDIKRILNSKL